MLINVAFKDGFDGDTVEIRIDGVPAYRREHVTTRTQISHAADTQLEVPDVPFTMEVGVPTRGVTEAFPLDPNTNPNVTISLLDGRIVPAYPEHLGFA